MSFNIIIPVRSPGEGKSRLSSALTVAERAALVERLFRHVLAQAIAATGSSRSVVVSSSSLLLDLARKNGARAVLETGRGMNNALTQAAAVLPPLMPVLALPADLPLLDLSDIVSLAKGLDRADVAIAPDRACRGTNALMFRRAGLIPFAFGENSYARHLALCKAMGLSVCVIEREGLGADLDLPADMALLAEAATHRQVANLRD